MVMKEDLWPEDVLGVHFQLIKVLNATKSK